MAGHGRVRPKYWEFSSVSYMAPGLYTKLWLFALLWFVPPLLLLLLDLWKWSALNLLFIYLDRMVLSLWGVVSDPVAALALLGDFIKFSLGPTLAFVLSQWAFRREEKRREKEDIEAFRLLVRLEIAQNINIFENLIALQEDFEKENPEIEFDGLAWSIVFKSFAFRKRFLDADMRSITNALSRREISVMNRFYGAIEQMENTVTYAQDTFGVLNFEKMKAIISLIKEMCQVGKRLLKMLEKGKPFD